MRKSYAIKCKITDATGIGGFLFKGEPVEGFVMLDAPSEEAFKTFIGQTFDVRWTLTKAPAMDKLPEWVKGTVVPDKFTPESRNLCLTFVRDGFKVTLAVDVADDATDLTVRATVSKKWMSTITVSGTGKLTR
jgi:hypothetical protein